MRNLTGVYRYADDGNTLKETYTKDLDKLIEKISKFNTYMDTKSVKEALEKGSSVYTGFSCWRGKFD